MEPNWIVGGVIVATLIALDIYLIRDWYQADKWMIAHPPIDMAQLDEARDVLAMFVDPAQVDELAPLMVDYAVNVRRQLPDVAMIFGKAIRGNPRALRHVGIDPKPGQTPSENYARLLVQLAPVAGYVEAIGYGKPSPLEEAISALSAEFERPVKWLAEKLTHR